MEFFTGTLANGLRIVHKTISGSQVTHLGLTINAGSRDERSHEQGLAHFIEHCLFKGTQRRKAYHILSRMDSVGAELNAFTSKEETVLYTSFLTDHLHRGMEVLADIALHSTFPEKELAKEREVILDEILSYQDSPSESIFDDFEELIYPDQPLGRNILGTEESIRRLSVADIHNFQGRRYHCSQMVLSCVGSLPYKKLLRAAQKYFGEAPASSSQDCRQPAVSAPAQRKVQDMDTFQAHILIGAPSYHNSHPLRPAAILLNNYLGGPAMNSRLNMNIRERHGIAYNIEASFHPYSDTGLSTIYLGTDKKFIAKSEALVHRELKRLREKKLTPTALHRAKQQLKGQYALGQEGGGNTMLAIGKSLLSRGVVYSSQEILQRIDCISAEQLLEVANAVYHPDNLSTLIYH